MINRFITRSRSRTLTVGFLSGLLLPAGLSLILALASAAPTPAAEQVTLSYGFIEASVSVQSLRNYAEQGEVGADLAPYLKRLSETERSQFRTVLQSKSNVSPVEVSQFLRSSIGDNILKSAGNIIQTPSRLNGGRGLRGALVLSAAEPEGLSVLGTLEKFPTKTVRINSRKIFQSVREFTALFQDTRGAIAAIAQQAVPEDNALNNKSVFELAQSGPYSVAMQSLTLTDRNRDRQIPVDLYLPASSQSSVPPAPLIVASPGLAGDRTGFAVIGNHLASHGFAVAALDHPGSDTANFEALLAGRADEIADPAGFSERPRDISYLLDELTRLNNISGPIANRLEMTKIGVIGHSYGGTTALSVAGAQLNIDTLTANCSADQLVLNAADPSMLLQCTALKVPQQFSEDLRDERIQAVMAMNPVTSSLFGQAGFSQLAVPSLLVSGSADPVSPALIEQIRPFIWLSEAQPITGQTDSSEHYLALIQGGSHLYDPLELNDADLSFTNGLVSPNTDITDSYLKALSLGFMQMTVARDPNYQKVLDRNITLNQQPLPLYVISTLTEAMLNPVPEAADPSSF